MTPYNNNVNLVPFESVKTFGKTNLIPFLNSDSNSLNKAYDYH